MAKQVFFEDVEVGSALPSLTKYVTTRQLVKWASASDDWNEGHYDKDAAQARGLPGVIVQGRLKAAFLGQLMQDWIGEQGTLRKLACTYRAVDFPRNSLICKGKVTKKYIDGDEHYVECELWIENAKGEVTVIGSAVATLPSRSR